MKKFLLSVLIFLFAATALPAAADTPSVTSFTAPSNLNSGQIATFSWTINGGGHSFEIFCTQGVKLLYASTNQPFPCGTEVSVSAQASYAVSIVVANVSGTPRVVTAEIIPKDWTLADYPAGAQTVSIYVTPSIQPIAGLYSSATSSVSGAPVTFSWSSPFLDGVNMEISCDSNISATSTLSNSSVLPCNTPIFSPDLPGTGSVAILFTNSAPNDLPITVTLLPAMSPGVYDGTHEMTLTETVASDAQKPVSLSISASRAKIYSGDSVIFNWSAVNAAGANLRFSCAPYLSLLGFSQATTTSLPCNNYAFANPLSPTGSTSVTFINTGLGDVNSTVTLFPQLKDGSYNGLTSQSVTITVSPVPAGGIPAIAPAPSNQNPNPAAPPAATTTIMVPPAQKTTRAVFIRPLDVGASGTDVTALQTFLAKDPAIYPEGLITGYFGPLTARAVGRLQIKYGLIKNSTDPAAGYVGPKTRQLLNSLQ